MKTIYPCDIAYSYASLFDVLILCGGEAIRMSPLCDTKPRPFLPLCNRPLIWYVLQPLIQQGMYEFYISAHEDSIQPLQHYLCNSGVFPNIAFEFLVVPDIISSEDNETCSEQMTDNCDALRILAASRKNRKSFNNTEVFSDRLNRSNKIDRDIMVLSCDVILSQTNLAPFINYFYTTCSTASALLVEMPSDIECTSKYNGKTVNKVLDKNKYAYELLHYNTKDTFLTATEPINRKVTKKNHENCIMGSFNNSILSNPHCTYSEYLKKLEVQPSVTKSMEVICERLFFYCPQATANELSFSPGFLFRRPNLTFTKNRIDAHVFLFKSSILDLLIANPEIRKIKEDLIPALTVSQFFKINSSTISSPDTSFKLKIPPHWLSTVDNSINASSLNSRKNLIPQQFDNLQVTAVIYPFSKDYCIMRIDNKEKYKSISEHILFELSQHSLTNISPITKVLLGRITKEVYPTNYSPHNSFISLTLSVIDASCTIVNSVIGKACKIGKNAFINSSILMDNVEIEENCIIDKAIICSNVLICKNKEIKPIGSSPFVIISDSIIDI